MCDYEKSLAVSSHLPLPLGGIIPLYVVGDEILVILDQGEGFRNKCHPFLSVIWA